MNLNLEIARSLSDRLVAARAAHRRAEHTLAVLLADLVAGQHFRPLGYVSVEDYAACALDLTARQTRDLVRIDRALPRLPKLAAALGAGTLDWTKARELVRVATVATEEAWIERASAVPSRVLELEVAASTPGALPPAADAAAAKGPALRRFVVQMKASDHDAVRAALAALRFDLDAEADELEDGDLLARIVEQWIHLRSALSEAQAPSTGERYRVTLEHCPACRQTEAADAEVSDTVAGEAACDAEVVDLRPGPTQGHVTQAVPPATRRLVMGRAKWRCEVPNCRNRLALDIHHVRPRARGGTHAPDGLVCICDGHHRAVHRGYLAIERRQDGSVTVRRAHDATTHVGPTARAAAAPAAAGAPASKA